MNREIKFRMWHKKSKKMFDVESINFKDRSLNMWNSGMYTLSTFSLDDVILMQYTGLHDKNGKEIYEGDIVKALISGRWFVGKVIYEHSGFTIDVMNNKELEFGRRGIIEHWTEVIGNIHDNPELLGGE